MNVYFDIVLFITHIGVKSSHHNTDLTILGEYHDTKATSLSVF